MRHRKTVLSAKAGPSCFLNLIPPMACCGEKGGSTGRKLTESGGGYMLGLP
jgi:hypothetical protein